MRPHRLAFGAAAAVVMTAAAACRFSLPAPTPTSVDLLGPVFATSTSLAATAASVPTDTPMSPTATLRTGPAQVCPTAANSPAAPSLTDPNRQIQELTAYLNDGGNGRGLDAAITDAGLAPLEGPSTLSLDLNNDGWLDLAVAVQDPGQDLVQPPGSLFVLTCQGSQYQLVFSLGPAPEHGTPQLLAGQDLNGDQLDDLLYGLPNCGASTCFLQIQVLAWQNGQVGTRFCAARATTCLTPMSRSKREKRGERSGLRSRARASVRPGLDPTGSARAPGIGTPARRRLSSAGRSRSRPCSASTF